MKSVEDDAILANTRAPRRPHLQGSGRLLLRTRTAAAVHGRFAAYKQPPQPQAELPPHVYAVAASAHLGMLQTCRASPSLSAARAAPARRRPRRSCCSTWRRCPRRRVATCTAGCCRRTHHAEPRQRAHRLEQQLVALRQVPDPVLGDGACRAPSTDPPAGEVADHVAAGRAELPRPLHGRQRPPRRPAQAVPPRRVAHDYLNARPTRAASTGRVPDGLRRARAGDGRDPDGGAARARGVEDHRDLHLGNAKFAGADEDDAQFAGGEGNASSCTRRACSAARRSSSSRRSARSTSRRA